MGLGIIPAELVENPSFRFVCVFVCLFVCLFIDALSSSASHPDRNRLQNFRKVIFF